MFLTLVNDFSRCIWVYLLKQKSLSVTMLKHFSYIETQFQTHVKSIRTDNAKEHREGEILQFYLQKAIFHQ